MQENPQCRKCPLWKGARNVCLPGSYVPGAKILILLDSPTFMEDATGRKMSGDGVKLVCWMFERMSIPLTEVMFEYVIKCYPPKGKMPGKKADRLACIHACAEYRVATLQLLFPAVQVGMGKLACEALTGHHQVGDFEGTFWDAAEADVRDITPTIWIAYSPNYALQSPGETPSLYRVLWRAAEQAGLTPVFNPRIKPFDWSEYLR